jgi:hypothetical protein
VDNGDRIAQIRAWMAALEAERAALRPEPAREPDPGPSMYGIKGTGSPSVVPFNPAWTP